MSANRATDRRALVVVSVSDLAGVARHVLDLASASGTWELAFLVPAGPLADLLADHGFDVGSAAGGCAFGQPAGLRSSGRALRAAVAAARPAVVHTHLAWADLLAAGTLPPSTRLVSTEHGIADVPRLYQRTRAAAAAKRGAHALRMRRTAAVIAVSHATAAAVTRLWGRPRRLEVVRNGVARPRAVSPGAAGRAFGFLGRLAPEKGLPALLDAFAAVRRAEDPDATLAIAGEGPLRGDVLRRADALGLGESMRLLGHVPAAELLEQVDVLVALSAWENCSYSILDAVVAGRGVVATAVGGNPEILPAGCLTAPGDTAAAAESMRRQALDPAQRPTLPSGWPTPDEMRERTEAVYAAAAAR